MKRLILIPILLLLGLASCDAPVSDVTQKSDDPAQISATAPTNAFNLEPVSPDTARKAAWQQFKVQNGSGWRVRWNEHTGLPAAIFSGLSEKAYSGGAEQAARNFMADHVGLFGLTNLEQLQYVKTQRHRGIRHVTFNQTVDGVPVYEAEYKVHLRANGQVDMANGTYYPNIEISTSPSVSVTAAAAAAKSDLENGGDVGMEINSELVIYRVGEQFHLARKLILFSREPLQDWLYFVDAHSGEVLNKFNRLTDVTGDGDVYPTHPGLSSVTKKPLYRLNGNGKLQGVYAYILNYDGAEAYSSSHSFIYSPSNTHFDEVNLYYHVDDFRHNFIENLDDGSLGFTQITAHAHATHPTYGDRNAWFSPSTEDIYFGDAVSSSLYNDFAKEDKVVHHEYSHAVIYDIQSGIISSSNEEGAISEGTPDFFAGSFTNRSQIGDYSLPEDRDMANPEIISYSQYESEEPVPAHEGGEFFSSILWDLRNGSVGKEDTAFLVYDALFRVTANPDFLDFRDAMISADYYAYGGSNVDDIQDTFAEVGIGLFSPPEVSITGPDSVEVDEIGHWSANVSGGSGPYSYTWYKTHYPQSPVIVSTSDNYVAPGDENGDFTLSLYVSYPESEEGVGVKAVYVTGDGCIGICN